MANSCKFQKTQYQVSYDSGTTWEDVVPTQFAKGELLEYDSPDCTSIETIYRWRVLEGQYICDGNNKYTKEIQEESYNNGITWYTSYPTVYRQGQYVGEDAEFCCDKFVGHYIYTPPPPSSGGGGSSNRCEVGYWDGRRCVRRDPLKIVKCDGNGVLTSADTKYYTSYYTLIGAEIGNSVTEIGTNAFRSCSGLTSIVIPSGVTSIGQSAFQSCTGLTSIDIPSGVTSIGDSAFNWCSSLTSITVDNANSNYSSQDGVLFNKTKSELIVYPSAKENSSYTLPSNVTSIDSYAFNHCSNLTSITINSATPPTVQWSSFNGTDCSIYVPCESLFDYWYDSNWSQFQNRIHGTPPCDEPSIPTKFYARYSDNTTVKYNCTSSSEYLTTATTKPSSKYSTMTDAEIGDCVADIGESAFTNCVSLTSVTIGNSVTGISTSAFYHCTSLTSINIPDSVKSIFFYAFAGCTGLTSVTIGSGVTSIWDWAFASCTSLSSITINATTPPYFGWTAEKAFSNTNDCPIYVPCESVLTYKNTSGWDTYARRIFGIPPCETPPLTNMKFYARYNDGAFNLVECQSSASTLNSEETKPSNYISSAMTYAEIGECVSIIGNSAFYQCTSLTGCTIGSGVISIRRKAFSNCSSLTSITIPSGVSEIGDYAFEDCYNLTSITVERLTPPRLTSTIVGRNPYVFIGTNCPIYVPYESVNSYKGAQYWSTYADRIQAIPT